MKPVIVLVTRARRHSSRDHEHVGGGQFRKGNENG